MMEQTELERKILEAAERLFLEKGFAQTSTTDIARAVGCNQALVHYYYRTKEKLFQGIFIRNMDLLLEGADQFMYDGDFFGTLRQLIDAYFALLSTHRQLPFFIMNELICNPQRRAFIRETLIKNERRQQVYYAFSALVRNETEKGVIREVEPLDLLLNAVSLVVMTFVTLPIYTDCLEKSAEEVDAYLRDRKAEIWRLLTTGLRPTGEETGGQVSGVADGSVPVG